MLILDCGRPAPRPPRGAAGFSHHCVSYRVSFMFNVSTCEPGLGAPPRPPRWCCGIEQSMLFLQYFNTVHACIYAYAYAYAYAHVYVHLYVYAYVCICTRICKTRIKLRFLRFQCARPGGAPQLVHSNSYGCIIIPTCCKAVILAEHCFRKKKWTQRGIAFTKLARLHAKLPMSSKAIFHCFFPGSNWSQEQHNNHSVKAALVVQRALWHRSLHTNGAWKTEDEQPGEPEGETRSPHVWIS